MAAVGAGLPPCCKVVCLWCIMCFCCWGVFPVLTLYSPRSIVWGLFFSSSLSSCLLYFLQKIPAFHCWLYSVWLCMWQINLPWPWPWPWWCYCAWLASKLAWPEPHRESMGYCQEEDERHQTQQCRWAEGHCQRNLGFLTTSAVPQTDHLHATLNWGSN